MIVNNLARYYGVDNKSIIIVSKPIKHTLFHYLNYNDIDPVKGHATIAVSIGNLNDLDFKNI